MPDFHPTRVVQTPGGESIEIDVELAPLIAALWHRDVYTMDSCQDTGALLTDEDFMAENPHLRAEYELLRGWARIGFDGVVSATRFMNLVLLGGPDDDFTARITHWVNENTWKWRTHPIVGMTDPNNPLTEAQAGPIPMWWTGPSVDFPASDIKEIRRRISAT